MRGKLFFGAATAALLMFVPGAMAQQADPAGDINTQARFSGEAVESELSPAGDIDWYRMSVSQGQRYAFTLDAIAEGDAAVDPTIGIYDAQGNQLAFNDDANGTLNSALQYAPQQSGDVFVAVGSFLDSGTGRYRLAATSSAVPADDVGNDATTRGRVQAGRAVTGELEYEGDVDSYRLAARSGQRYRITLVGADGDGALGDPYLRVVDADGNELTSNDDDGESLNSSLEFVPAAAGNVFVEARSFADAGAGRYTLNITAERAPTDNISADRNTRGRVNVGGSVNGTIDFASDADWYRVRLEEGQSYRFTLDSSGDTPLGDPLLRLRGSDGEEIAQDDDGGEGFNSYLEFTAPSTGNYYIEANAFSEGTTGAYTLSARAGDVPADNTTDATLSADGDYREGVLSPAGDRDWYRINLAEGQGVRVGLTSSEAGGPMLADPYLSFYDANGTLLFSDDDGGDGLNAWLEFSAPADGAYYVEARGFDEAAVGRYAISVTAGEIGSSYDGAEYLTPGPEGRISTIGAADDSDWFLVEMIEGRTYRFNVDGIEEGALADPVLTLFDSQGNQIAQDDDGGAGFNSYLTFASPTGGSYFAAVSSFNGETGRYMLRVTDTDVPGHIYTDENLAQENDQRVSRIEMEGDLDYYRVELEGGVRYQIELNGNGDHPLADPVLTIVNEENTTLASDDDSGPGRNARLNFTPESTGTYFIQASGLGGTTGWYQVSIVRQ